ncbi:IS1182 family transposase [Pseudalkalibacillus sp. A8]|uniref:IS1182 family transposase n=1 Tax=Pseudalkalibacillus sp. A8 TaxID=3382641 RepID=UPI0038B5A532
MLKDQYQETLSFHAELYNLIPEDHLLKKIDKVVDFSFIYDLTKESYCMYYGRPATEPELLLRILLIQTLYDLSDDQVIQDANLHLAYKWFLRLNPESSLPHPTQLSRFRNHRLGANRVEEVLEELVKQCQEKGIIQSKALILDSTHAQANASKRSPLQVLTKAASRLSRAVKKQHTKLHKKLPKAPKLNDIPEEEQAKEMLRYLAHLGEQIEQALPDAEGAIKDKLETAKRIVEDERLLSKKGILSAVDPDARFGWKSTTKSFYGYKNHLAMTEEEIITGVQVTPGNVDDGKQLKELVNQSKAGGMEVNEILADTAYSSKHNLSYLQQNLITASIPLNPSVYGAREEDNFQYDKERDQVICPAGHHSIRKARTGKKDTGTNQMNTFYFDVDICKECPLKEGCYKEGKKSKTYSIRIISEEHQQQMKYLDSEEYQERKKVRPSIEHKNAELKRFHGLTRAKYRGLLGMKIQTYLSVFAVNIKRMTKLLPQNELGNV